MRAYELPVKIGPEGQIDLPKSITRLLPPGKTARVLILVPDPSDVEEQNAWYQLAGEQFVAGYAEADAVYDRP
jgi:hypothetical protein